MTPSKCAWLAVLFFLLALTAGSADAVEPDSTSPLGSFLTRHQIGARLGGWINLGDTPPELDTAAQFETNFHDGSFFFEGYYAHRFTRALMGEFSLGIANRGSVTFLIDDRSNVGSVMVYSVLLHGKLYPFGGSGWRLQPYFTAGGGLYYARRSVQFSTSDLYYYYPGLDEESRTDFSYALGGGFDLPVSSQIGLDLNIRYLPVVFGDPLMTIEDYSAVTVTIGVKYLYSGPSNESDPNRRM